MADDTSNVAAKVVENTGVTEGPNPTFAQLQFGVCPLWSTGRILASLQLTQDSPVLFDYLTAEFARRFARGLGASFITTLLAGVDSFSAASASGITPDDLLGLMGAVDAAYAMRGGWLMNWSTWLSVKKLRTSDHYFATEVTGVDDSGHYTLLQRPVCICPSLDNLGIGKKPILYGDLQRFVARSVNATQTVNKYIEAFMANHQLGFEGIWRVDSALAKASATDAPIKALYMPLS